MTEMKPNLPSLLATFAVLLHAGVSYSGPVDLTRPGTAIGHADTAGRAYYSIDLAKVTLSARRGDTIPVHIDFSSGRSGTSPVGVPGWRIPILESRIEPLADGESIAVHLPCGKSGMLSRTSPDRYETDDGAWSLSSTPDGRSLRRDDGWELHFTELGLVRMVTDAGVEWLWERDGDGRVAAIRKEGEEPVLTAAWKDGRLENLEIGDLKIDAERKGEDAVRIQVASADFIRNFDLSPGAGSMKVEEDGDLLADFSWDGGTGFVGHDGLNRYEIVSNPGEDLVIAMVDPIGRRQAATIRDGRVSSIGSTERERRLDYAYFREKAIASNIQSVDFSQGDGPPVRLFESEYDDLNRLRKISLRGPVPSLNRMRIPDILDPVLAAAAGMVVSGAARDEPPVVIEYTYESGPLQRHVRSDMDGAETLRITYGEDGTTIVREILDQLRIEEHLDRGMLVKRVVFSGGADAAASSDGDSSSTWRMAYEENYRDGRFVDVKMADTDGSAESGKGRSPEK